MRLSTGRVLNTDCPFMNDCWGNQGCVTTCPDSVLDVLKKAGANEHQLGWVPHTDPEIAEVCEVCKGVPPFEPDFRLIKTVKR